MSKDKPIYGLDKLPDEILIKHLRVELGKLSSYIEELEHKLKAKEPKEVKESRLEHLNNRIANLEKELEKSRDRNRELMRKVNNFEREALERMKRDRNEQA